jgi:hypothetical protein
MKVSVRAVLFGDAPPTDSVADTPGWRALIEQLGASLGPVSPAGRGAVERELGSALGGLLNLNLGDVLVGGWRRHRGLATAAQNTRANPGASELVQLATHRITTSHRPHVDVVVNGATLATVGFELALTLDVDGVLATVRDAHLVSLHGGRCTVAVRLTCGGHDLIARGITLDPVVTVDLAEPVALLPEEAAHPARGRAAAPHSS